MIKQTRREKMETQETLVKQITKIGRENQSIPLINDIEPFQYFFTKENNLDYDHLDERDGSCTRRELILRFLLLSAVIDQGPDIVGVRNLLKDVTNTLYRREVRFLHNPLSFFKELGLAIDTIIDTHTSIKDIRSAIWAKENKSSANRYNLFMDNSSQVLNYTIFRWGVPLSVPLLLDYDSKNEDVDPELLVDYLESYKSSEDMSDKLKSHERYGLGKAIGNKASHLFAKWMVSSLKLSRRKDKGWSDWSYEVPYDSNAGRVLWRTGYLLKWAPLEVYKKKSVVQPKRGKGGTNYIRVTNIRGIKTPYNLPKYYEELYKDLCTKYLKTHKRSPKTIEIQRIQHLFLMESDKKFSAADFDDGLIYIGTTYCFNHSKPLCKICPINTLCEGYNQRPELINNYRT